MLDGHVSLDVVAEGIGVGQDPRDRQEDPRHPHAGVAERGRERREPAEGEPRRSDQGVRVEHPQQDEVDEEALGPALLLGEVTVLQVGRHDAGVVRAIPVPRGGFADELQGRERARAWRRSGRGRRTVRPLPIRRAAAARWPPATRDCRTAGRVAVAEVPGAAATVMNATAARR